MQLSLTSYFGEVLLQYMMIIAVIAISLISLLSHNPHIIDSMECLYSCQLWKMHGLCLFLIFVYVVFYLPL